MLEVVNSPLVPNSDSHVDEFVDDGRYIFSNSAELGEMILQESCCERHVGVSGIREKVGVTPSTMVDEEPDDQESFLVVVLQEI